MIYFQFIFMRFYVYLIIIYSLVNLITVLASINHFFFIMIEWNLYTDILLVYFYEILSVPHNYLFASKSYHSIEIIKHILFYYDRVESTIPFSYNINEFLKNKLIFDYLININSVIF